MAERKKRLPLRPGTHDTNPSYIVVTRFESLPSGVYCLFRTKLKDWKTAATRKQKALGLKGNITTAVPYEVDSQVAAKIEKSVRASLPKFQFGKEVLLRCSLDTLHRAINDASSQEPKQVALRFRILEKQIVSLEDQLAALNVQNTKLTTQNAELSKSLRVAESKERVLNEKLRLLRKDFNDAQERIGELEDEAERQEWDID